MRNINYWFKFKIKNTSNESGIWILGFEQISYLDIFLVDSFGKIEFKKTGYFIPASQKEYSQGRHERVSLKLNAGETKTIYAKTCSNVNYINHELITIADIKSDSNLDRITNLEQGVFHGLLWIMLLYNLFLFISVREKSGYPPKVRKKIPLTKQTIYYYKIQCYLGSRILSSSTKHSKYIYSEKSGKLFSNIQNSWKNCLSKY